MELQANDAVGLLDHLGPRNVHLLNMGACCEVDDFLRDQLEMLGPEGGWKEPNGCYEARSRLIDACVGFDSKSRLADIRCPALIIHAGNDVVAGKEQKIRFASTLFEWLAAN